MALTKDAGLVERTVYAKLLFFFSTSVGDTHLQRGILNAVANISVQKHTIKKRCMKDIHIVALSKIGISTVKSPNYNHFSAEFSSFIGVRQSITNFDLD